MIREEPMQVSWHISPISNWQVDILVFYGFEKSGELLPGFRHWLETAGGWLQKSQALRDFQGKYQQISVCYGPEDADISRVMLVGLGPAENFDMDKLRGATAAALKKCRELELPLAGLPLAAFEGMPLDCQNALLESLVAGISGLYRFDALKTRDVSPQSFPEKLILFSENEPTESFRQEVSFAESLISGITLARDLVSAPSNQVTPGFMVSTARDLAEAYGFRIQVIDKHEAEQKGMNSFLAVARGSQEPAYIIILEYLPPTGQGKRPLVFVGKGITFDTGGISLKPSDRMEMMKRDMAGAAAVLGVFEIIGKTRPDQRVVGIMPCTENMPGSRAYKPGDVITSLANLTIEVISTDAEGRMILCDAITYGLSYQPELIVDVATLTGAAIIALGNQVAAVMGNRDELLQKLKEIGNQVGERLWPLPLYDAYFDLIKSDIADFKNVGDRAAGTIVGGMFLKQFVPDGIPWAHLDIAGTAWTDKDLATSPKGATGFGVRILAELVRRWVDMGLK